MRERDRDRRLKVLEAEAARRAKAEDKLDWTLFDPEALAAVLELVESFGAGTLTEAEACERIEAIPGAIEGFELAYAERDARRSRR